MSKKHEKIMTTVLSTWLILILVLFIFLPKREVSIRERRKLATYPKLSFNNIMKGNFISDLDKYIQDHFPFRDNFQNIKINLDQALLKLQSNGYGEYKGYIINIPGKLGLEQYKKTADYYKSLTANLFKNQNPYFSLIPDKNFYIESGFYPKINYDGVDKIFNETFGKDYSIDISKSLGLKNFYKSDLHWKQESLDMVIEEILKKLDLNREKYAFEKKKLGSFYGAYGSASGKTYIKDDLFYLYNQAMESYEIRDILADKSIDFYEKKLINSIDPYSVFLSGPKALIEIKKKSFTKNSESLYIFRDSFCSSLAPLLSLHFDRIVLIDSRYVSKKILEEKIFPNKKDKVLILLSYEIIKDPSILKS